MSTFSLGFLKEITIEQVTAPAPRNTKKEANPPADAMCIRVWKDGSVYPSAALVSKFNLEYPKASEVKFIKLHNPDGTPKVDEKGVQLQERKVIVEASANGLDVFTLKSWHQAKTGDDVPDAILVGVSPKSAGKVELFSNVKYNDDCTPQNSVMDQGATTFGKTNLLPMLESVYGVTPGEEGYVDLLVDTSFDLKVIAANGIFMLPKVTVRGTDKGKADVIRRENISVFGLVPMVSATPAAIEPQSEIPTGPANYAPDNTTTLVPQQEAMTAN